MPATVRVDCAAPRTPLVENTVRILSRQIADRTGILPGREPTAEVVIELGIQPGIGREGFRVEAGSQGPVRVTGNDERGLLYGVGRFLRASRFGEGRFEPAAWHGASVPQKEVRGIYFATHFHNFYHDAPVPEVCRYVEDLALWGCNALAVWFDMHHYTGISDPAAQRMIERLHSILRAANGVGMAAVLLVLGNEAYSGSPEALRAAPTPSIGHYHVELCPHKPGAAELMLRWRQEAMEAFCDLDIGQVILWPHDQGGCACGACAPWGANGFLAIAEPVARLARRYFPRARIVLSTWCFDYEQKGEWEGLAQRFARRPDWVDYLMADGHAQFPQHPLRHGTPGGLPLLNFPEISMQDMYPWGGFGANPLPQRFQRLWAAVGDRLAGGFPYSEGIFEDLNKAVALRHYWDAQDAMDTVREYAAYECSPEAADDVARAVALMEQNSAHGLTGAPLLEQGAQLPLYKVSLPAGGQAGFDLLRTAEARLGPRARQAWRWRILWLRAALDAEMDRTGGKPAEQSEAYFDELTRLYCAEEAEAHVAPPGLRALRRLYTQGQR